MIHHAICIDGPENHLLSPIQCHLNGVHISEVTKFLADSLSVATQTIQLTDPFNASYLPIIPFQLSNATSCFDVYSSSIAEYEDEEIPKIHLTAEEPSWDPSTNEHSERET